MSVYIANKILKKQPIEKQTPARLRNIIGMIASGVGILANAFIGLSKLIIGLIFDSISVASDGLNNISDTASSTVSLVSFKIADKPADKKHPFGHARVEYLSAMIISFIIIAIGIELIRTSISKIIENSVSTFSYITIGVLSFSILIKILLFAYNYSMYKKIKSDTLKGVAIDCINDCITSVTILACTLITKYTGFNLDGYVGIGVALLIIFQGVKLMTSTFNPLLGEKPDAKMVDEIAKQIKAYNGVLGIHDMIIHNYGPNKYFVSVHVEVDSTQDVMASHEMIDKIERELSSNTLQLLIHMDPINIGDEKVNEYKKIVACIIEKIDTRLTFHDFRMVIGPNQKNLIFDVVVPAEYKTNKDTLTNLISDKIKQIDKSCNVVINIDQNYTEC